MDDASTDSGGSWRWHEAYLDRQREQRIEAISLLRSIKVRDAFYGQLHDYLTRRIERLLQADNDLFQLLISPPHAKPMDTIDQRPPLADAALHFGSMS
jgi:hypothetical protein